jgi:tetratricopeptide (TPR) repeat protein
LTTLKLKLTSFTDTANWAWQLSDDRGVFVADHVVALDQESPEYRAFIDLYRVVRWKEAAISEAALVKRVSDWIRHKVWGPVGDAIVARAAQEPVTVHLSLSPAAGSLLFLPLEIGLRMDPSPGAMEIGLVSDVEEEGESRSKRPIGDRLRMLGIFSMPIDQTALNVRREHHELRRLVHRVARAAGRAVELRTLQYGVTRELIEEVLDEGEGWDVIHFSGHGLPAGLVLEQEDGSADVVQSDEIADLLWPTRGQLKLVTLSSCESGAAEAVHTMQLLGVETSLEQREMIEREGDEVSATPLPSLAQSLSSMLGCASLAMRYPVGDDFAIALSAGLYEGLLEQGQSLPRALQRALVRTQKRGAAASPGLSLATPTLIGRAALDLKLTPPPGEPMSFDPSATNMAEFPLEPETFVGRVGPLARARAALAASSQARGVVFHGMAGAGKTACALELAYRHRQHRFEAMAWFVAPKEGHDIRQAFSQFTIALQGQVKGLEFAHLINDLDKLKAFFPTFRRLLADRSLLLVIDNVESLLAADGTWRDERWELLLGAAVEHDGLSRVVLTSRLPPKTMLDDPRIRIEPIHSLSARESVLLARQLPNLGALMLDGLSGDVTAGRNLVRRALEVVQGNPKLIELADAQAADPEVLGERIAEADKAWADRGDLEAFFASGEPDGEITPEDFLKVIESWTASITQHLPPAARTMFKILCCLEEEDRLYQMVEPLWKVIRKREIGVPEDLWETVDGVAGQGLVDVERIGPVRRFRLHPAVESAGQRSTDEELRIAIEKVATDLWIGIHKEAMKRNDSQMVVRAGLRVAPYLLRLNEPGRASIFASSAVIRDASIPTLATAMPILERAVQAAAGSPSEFQTKAVLVRARATQSVEAAIPELQELQELAEQREDFGRVLILLVDLFDAFVRSHRLEEAERVLDEIFRVRERMDLGPWTRFSHEVLRLRLMLESGESAKVLEELPILIEQMEGIVDSPRSDIASSWNVRESLLGIGVAAALSLQRWEQALTLNKAIRESEEEREAPALKRAWTAFGAFGALVELGRLQEAEEALVQLHRTLEASGDLRRLGEVFGSWAILELRRNNRVDALAFIHKALRHSYAEGEPHTLVTDHNNLATILESGEGSDPKEVIAHRLAAALISLKSQGAYARSLYLLGATLTSYGEKVLPQSFEELCVRLEQTDGCEFRAVWSRLGLGAESDDEALARVLEDASKAMEHLANQENLAEPSLEIPPRKEEGGEGDGP